METAASVNDVPIRLTYERWFHITENHNDLAGYYFELLETIEKPDLIVRGNKGTLKVSSDLTKLPITHVRADYDKEADVLYLSFLSKAMMIFSSGLTEMKL